MSFVSKQGLSISKCLSILTLGFVPMSSLVLADSLDEPINFEIDAQTLDTALIEFSEQADVQLVVRGELVVDLESDGLRGEFTPRTALAALLDNTGLTYTAIGEDSVAVATDQAARQRHKKTQQAVVLTAGEPAKQEPANNEGDDSEDNDAASEQETPQDLEEIIVTGSRLINDPGKLTRQITIFNRAEIERSGATRLDEFLSRLPQNMNAPNNVGSGLAVPGPNTAFGLGENMFAGSSINLRGLGAQYTLILINNRRPARGGQFGTITDISNIPIDSIERIEILFDGAAAIYGADAVGGVVNIITNREYDGTNIDATYSDTQDGGGARYNLTLGHTFNWDSGSFTASVSYQTQEQIDGAQRHGLGLGGSALGGVFGDDLILPPSANGNIRGTIKYRIIDGEFVGEPQPLMWVKGDQRLSAGVEVPVLRWVNSEIQFVETTAIVNRQNPILPSAQLFWIDEAAHRPQDPETLGFTPVYQADLPQYSGRPLSLADISASDELGENPFSLLEGQAISPEDETYSIAMNFRQDFLDNLSLNLNLRYTDTYKASNQDFMAGELVAIRHTSPSNPFLQDFDFAFQDRFPWQFQEVNATGYDLSGGIDWGFAKDWSLTFGFGVSELKSDSDTMNFLRRSGSGPDTLRARLQGYHILGDGIRELTGSNFNDPLLGYGSLDEMLVALVVPFMHTHNYSESYDADIRLRGKLFELPGGDVHSSLSLRYREERAEFFHNNLRVGNSFGTDHLGPGSGSGYDEVTGENVKSFGAEISVPVFGEDFRLPLVERLLLSLSGSLEDPSHTDENAYNWAVGFNWGLSQDFVVRLNRTYSLYLPPVAYTAREPEWVLAPYYDLYSDVDDRLPALRVYDKLWLIRGGANHLTPERNYGTALSFIYRPSFVKGLDIQLNITESHTVDQIGAPHMASNWTLDTVSPEAVLSNPLFAYADPENNPFHATAVGGIPNPVTGELEPAEILPGELIFDTRHYNIGDTFNRGADLQVRYNLMNTGFGDWMLTWRHQYLDVNRVTRSNLCEQVVETACNYARGITGSGFGVVTADDRGYGVPIDTVGLLSRENFTSGFPLPRNRGSIELVWGFRGLGVSLSTTYQETTSIIKTRTAVDNVIVDYIEFNGIQFPIFEQRTSTNILREDTRPARSLNMTLSYDFGRGSLFKTPRWFDNARLSLSIANLYQGERKRTVTFLQKENDVPEPIDVNRLSISPRGRAYSLRFSNTF